ADIDPRRLDREPDDLALVQHRRAAVVDQAGVEAGAADVGGDRVAQVELAGQVGNCASTRDGSGEDRIEQPPGRLAERPRAAARAHDHAPARDALSAAPTLDAPQVVPA